DSVEQLETMRTRLQAHDIEVLGVTDHHVFKSIYFFDPNGIRLELSADIASAEQMERESHEARARLDAWTARKAQWRLDRKNGLAESALKPQQNDRPEVGPRAGSSQPN